MKNVIVLIRTGATNEHKYYLEVYNEQTIDKEMVIRKFYADSEDEYNEFIENQLKEKNKWNVVDIQEFSWSKSVRDHYRKRQEVKLPTANLVTYVMHVHQFDDLLNHWFKTTKGWDVEYKINYSSIKNYETTEQGYIDIEIDTNRTSHHVLREMEEEFEDLFFPDALSVILPKVFDVTFVEYTFDIADESIYIHVPIDEYLVNSDGSR